MSEVGALIIKLQAETAQFREDMGKVKSDLNDLKGTSEDTGQAMDHSFTEARGGLMLTEEMVGVRLPRHLNTLIAEIPGVGAAFASMLPIVGVLVAIEIIGKLLEKHRELKEAAAKLADDQMKLGTTAANAFATWEEKINRTAEAMDDLSGNHADKLKRQLKDIDHQTMKELVQQFAELDRAAMAAFADLKTTWYQFGEGSEGAKDALDKFSIKYAALMAKNTDEGKKQAQDLLAGTLDSAQKYLAIQEKLRANPGKFNEEALAYARANDKAVDSTDKAYKAQQQLVELLQDKVQLTQKAAEAEKAEVTVLTSKDNLKTMGDEVALQKIVTAGVDAHAAALRKLAQTQAESAVSSDKGDKNESAYDKLNKSLEGIAQEHDAAVAAANQILASKKVLYDTEMKAAGTNVEKKKELEAQYANEVRATDDTILQADADAKKKSVALTTAAAAEKSRIEKAAAQQAADDTMRTAIEGAKQKEKIDMESAKNLEALHQKTAKQAAAVDVAAVNAETQTEVKAYDDRIKNLNRFSADYEKQVKALQDKIVAVEQQGAARVTQINQAAMQKQLADVRQAEDKMASAVSENIAKSIFEHKNMAKSFEQLGQQMVEGMAKQLLMMELTHNKEKLINAKGAFDKSFNWASAWGGLYRWCHRAGATAFTGCHGVRAGRQDSRRRRGSHHRSRRRDGRHSCIDGQSRGSGRQGRLKWSHLPHRRTWGRRGRGSTHPSRH